jgi:uncharacterized protein
MQIEFDPDKDEINPFKHRLPLAFGRRVLAAENSVVVETFRIGDEENRFKAIGVVDGKLYTVVHVWREAVIRMISVRRSNASEQRLYDRDTSRSE